MEFLELPDEIIVTIMLRMRISTIGRLAQTCSSLRLLASEDSLWQLLALRHGVVRFGQQLPIHSWRHYFSEHDYVWNPRSDDICQQLLPSNKGGLEIADNGRIITKAKHGYLVNAVMSPALHHDSTHHLHLIMFGVVALALVPSNYDFQYRDVTVAPYPAVPHVTFPISAGLQFVKITVDKGSAILSCGGTSVDASRSNSRAQPISGGDIMLMVSMKLLGSWCQIVSMHEQMMPSWAYRSDDDL
eukprot:TRINITY_DN12579_c0_g1_i1.p1 TRINITY_DN12579_c0_g1~~TRINITY_DN12579_c0_g1_i1.p1  ORF type:complete len:244 (-),score=36.06 TRINITY_DN12579_c0_g1_i1:78-809(-)